MRMQTYNFRLDGLTVHLLTRLSLRGGLSRAEILRSLIRSAAARELGETLDCEPGRADAELSPSGREGALSHPMIA